MHRSTRSGLLIGAALLFIILLISTISEQDFHQGRPLPSSPYSGSDGGSSLIENFFAIFQNQAALIGSQSNGIQKVISLYAVPLSIAVLLILALLVLLSGKIRQAFLMRVLAGLAAMVIILSLFYSSVPDSEDKHGEMIITHMGTDIGGDGSVETGTEEIEAPPEIPRSLSWFFSFIILIPVILVPAVIIRKIVILRRESGERSLLHVTEEAMESIRSGSTYEDVILRCYDEMAIYAKDKAGLTRKASMTPAEFKKNLIEEGLPAYETGNITALFQKVRYGGGKLTEQEESMAESSLRAIAEALEKR